MNRKGFVDTEILASPAFVILAVLAVSATLIGWIMGPKIGFEEAFPVWQLVVIIVVEIVAAYIITARMS
jgi:hypothetical protein